MTQIRADQTKVVIKQMRTRLDDFYSCLFCCLNYIHDKEAFMEMCNVLNKELLCLVETLILIEETYQEELPLESEEPKDVNWSDEKDRMMKYRDSFLRHEFACQSDDAYIKPLIDRLEDAAECMARIDEELFPEDDCEIYVSYSKREMDNYNLNRWAQENRKLRNDIAIAPIKRQKELIETKMNEAIAELHSIGTFFFSEDSSYIYYEGLGRHLWQMRHTNNAKYTIDKILGLIKTIEYLCSRIDRKFVFIDRENSPEEETEETQLKRILEETLQSQLPKVLFRLKRCSEFLDKDFSEGFFDEMLRNLINSEHSAKVCEKMSMGKINKFTLQIAGLLKKLDVFCDCKNQNLAEAINFNNPTMESCVSYIRKQIDDEPEIQQWITDYIAQYKVLRCEGVKM